LPTIAVIAVSAEYAGLIQFLQPVGLNSLCQDLRTML